MQEPLVRLQGATKRFGQTGALVLDRIDLAIASGQTTALVGPSGCGKTTLLRIIVGLEQLTSGELTFDPPHFPDPAPRRRCLRLGYVVQAGGLFPHMTVRQNACLMAGRMEWPTERISARFLELAELIDIGPELHNRYPFELSGGQAQRVGLLRALMLDPGLILMDEPLGALDPMSRSQLQGHLRDIFSRLGKGVLIVTHDLNEACLMADRIVVMHDGRIVETGNVEEVRCSHHPFVRRFLEAGGLGLQGAERPEARC